MCGKYYYCIDNDFINKYQVDIDRKKLIELRKIIIDKCSKIVHKDYKSTCDADYLYDERIINYKKNKLGCISYNDFFMTDEIEYHIEYDYYEYSVLVFMIDQLINGKVKVINDLRDSKFLELNRNNKLELNDTNLKAEIERLISDGLYDEIDELVQINSADLILKNQEILELEKFYLYEINSCIKLSIVDQVSIENFFVIKNFFDDCDIKQNVSSNLVKMLGKD